MRFANNFKTAVLLGGMFGLCMLAGHLMGGPRGVIIGFLFGGVGALVSYFFSDRLALAANGGHEVTVEEAPQLHATVAKLAQRAGIPMPRVCVFEQEAPNAFATGRGPKHSAVAVSTGMLNNFPMPEIEGVLAHEISHIVHRDVLIGTIAAVLAGAISQMAYMFLWFGGGRDRENSSPLGAIGGLLMLILAPLAAGLIQMAISRQREFAADSAGGELCGDPNKLADALERLERGNRVIPTNTNPAFHSLYIAAPLGPEGGAATLFSTHPPIAQRVALLRQQAARSFASGRPVPL